MKGRARPSPAHKQKRPTLESRQAQGEATMTLLPTPSVLLPTGELDEDRAIDWVAVLISKVRPGMEKEFGREWLQTELQKGLREGELTPARHAVRLAQAGDEICDAALRNVFAEMLPAGGQLPGQGPGWMQVWAYGQDAVLRDRHKRPRGHRWHDDLVRNIQICLLIALVCRELDVQASRNRAARRTPSGISLVVAALARINIIHLNEESVQQNIWFGPPGELVRAIVPTYLRTRLR